MARKVSHPDELVARIKAAAALGIPRKLVARKLGMSFATVRRYADGERRADVAPDPAFAALFAAFMRGEI